MADKYRHEFYVQVFWSHDDEGYIAAVADWPGENLEPNAFGDTPAEALSELATVLAMRASVERGEDPSFWRDFWAAPPGPVDAPRAIGGWENTTLAVIMALCCLLLGSILVGGVLWQIVNR